MPKYTIYAGDCLDILPTLEANSVDSIVTDPPYGLSSGPAGYLGEKTGGGFMGKDWDHGVPGVHFWQEALRVAKPGAHLLAFGGTRTFHRLACAIEDAGWEIRDTVMWVYGCLSDDTEILTTDGWKTYDMLSCDSTAMCYNVNSDSLELGKIEEVFTYEISDTAYHIQSNHTDQIVTREHRCLVERGGKYVFRKASTLELQETIPFLEGVPDVWSTIPYPRPHASNEKQILQQGMPSGSSGEGQQRRAPREAQADYVDLPCLWDEVLATSSIRGTYRQSDLQLPLQWGVTGSGMGKARTQGPRCLETGERSGISRTDDRRHESSMEGGNNVLQNTRQLSRCEVRALSSRVQGNGTQRWLCDGAPSDSGTTLGALSETHRSCTPQRPRPDEQQPRQFDAIQKQFGTQTIRGEGTTAPTLATVTPIHYDGVVWCVRVPTGAFVARRNGHVFVTGNSGFPKSLAVDKAIDKAAGAERETKATKTRSQSRPTSGGTQKGNGTVNGGYNMGHDYNITAPATPAARQWAGWGTALKPAWEPVIVARKPLIGTVAANVLAYGTGAINIDGTRVGGILEGDPNRFTKAYSQGNGNEGWKRPAHDSYTPPVVRSEGRWPANLVLSYPEDEIDQDGNPLPNPAKDGVLAGFPVTKSGGTGGGGKTFHGQAYKRPEKTRDSDTGSAARFFYCAKSSRSDRNEGLDGLGGLSKLRDDLTDEQRQYVMRELQKEGLV